MPASEALAERAQCGERSEPYKSPFMGIKTLDQGERYVSEDYEVNWKSFKYPTVTNRPADYQVAEQKQYRVILYFPYSEE